jgi:DNA end-binding protein Ku
MQWFRLCSNSRRNRGDESGAFPKKFEDRYEDALKDLIKRKQSGKPIERTKPSAPTNVVNLMDALRKSVQSERGGGERRKTEKSVIAIARRRRLGGRALAIRRRADGRARPHQVMAWLKTD